MKKIFYYLMSAVVAFGAMACQNDIEDNVTPGEGGNGEKVSFVAEVGDVTRVAIGDKDDDYGYPITLDENDVLIAQYYKSDTEEWSTAYTFRTTDGKNFSCETPGVSELIGQLVTINNREVTSYCSLCGVDGIQLRANVASFGDNSNITLEVANAVLMFESEYDVTFNSTGDLFCYDSECGMLNPANNVNSLKIPASEGVHYVAVNGGIPTTFSYSIDDVMCKEITTTFVAGKLYNLGTLDKPSAWNIRGGHNDWSTTANPMYLEGDYFVARNMTLTAEGFQFNQGEWDKQIGAYQEYEQEVAKAPVGEWYQSQYNHDSYKGNIMVEDVNKKYDIYLLNSETMAYFYIAESGALPTFNSYALAGTFNDWSDTPMVATSTFGLFVAEDIELVGYEDRIKVKSAYVDEDNDGWGESYGGGITNLEPNKFMSLNGGGSDIVVTTDGTYDVYFDYFARKLYLVEADADYTTATEQTENGPGKPVVAGVTIKGDWDSWQDATALVVKGDYYVAENVTIAAGQGFKFITGEGVYMGGSTSVGTWNAFGNSNIELAAGTYDLYVSPANAVWCAVAAGSAAPALNKKYLVLDAKEWNQGDARFQAWCWGGSSADAWVSFTYIDGNYFTAEIKDYTGCKLYRRGPDHNDNQWNDNSWNNSGDLSITHSLCRFTGWSTFEFVDLM